MSHLTICTSRLCNLTYKGVADSSKNLQFCKNGRETRPSLQDGSFTEALNSKILILVGLAPLYDALHNAKTAGSNNMLKSIVTFVYLERIWVFLIFYFIGLQCRATRKVRVVNDRLRTTHHQ